MVQSSGGIGVGEPWATSRTVAMAAGQMLTFDGRLPSADPDASLSLEERALVEALGDAVVQPGVPPPGTTGAVCHFAKQPYGRPYVSLTPPAGGDLIPLGWTPLSAGQLAEIERVRLRLDPLQVEGDAEVNTFLSALAEGGLAAIIREVITAIDHTDPVLLYVEDALYTNFDRFNNLLPRSGGKPEERFLLSRLPGLPPAELGLGERRFLFCVHVLRRADLGVEEFNGRQFTPWALRAFFDRKYLYYRTTAASSEPWPTELMEQAACLRRMKARLRETHTVYRWINGITFRKEERWRPRDDWASCPPDVPESVRQHCLERHGITADFADHDAYFREVVRAIARVEDPALRSQGLEELIEAVVRAAMQELPSHLGMSRGMRDLRHFQDALEEGRFDDVCAAPMADGFCAVFAQDESLGFCAPQPPASVLTAVSRRMQFNHWHYTPGHFTPEQLSVTRHFYNPPSMSDVAEMGDLQHPGHAFAHVRYAMRSSAGLRIGGRTYTGLVDLRLMRAVGRPYTDSDLRVADRYTEIIRTIAQSVLGLKEEGLRAPVISGFEREYYERRYPRAEGEASPDGAADPSAPLIGAMLRGAMQRHAERGAILCAETGRRFTLGEVRAVGQRLAVAAGPGRKVVILCADRVHQALLITAGLAAGLVVCPLDHALPGAALDTLLAHVRPDVVVTDSGTTYLPALASGRAVRVESLTGAAADPSSLQGPTGEPGGMDPWPGSPAPQAESALLIYTSGTTGSPKGVLLTERSLGANVSFALQHFGYEEGWISGCLLPLNHTFATVSDLLPVLCAGGRVVIAAGFKPNDAGASAKALADHGVRSFSAVPIILEALLALRVPLPESLRFAISGASPLTERTRTRYLERFGHPVVPCYGLTESVCFATASPVGGGRPGAVGRAAGIEIRVLGPDLQPLRRGETGEIALRGASVITGGYFQRGADREETFLERGWFLTGDMGHLDDEGYLYITGRRKHMIIRGGEKLYLEDLDRCLEEHGAVAEACCVQVPGLFGYERAVAFLVAAGSPDPARPDAGELPDRAGVEQALRAHVRARLGPDGAPDELVWVSRIPRSASGKPLRSALRGQSGDAQWQ